MKIKSHIVNNTNIAEIVADGIILSTVQDGLDLLGNMHYQGFDKIIIYEKNIKPDFFNLKSKLAGEILQKFTQYQMPLTIIGDFSKFSSKSLQDFIFESNKGQQVNFVSSMKEILNAQNR